MNQTQVYLPKLTLINKAIIIMIAVVFTGDALLSKLSGVSLVSYVGLSALSFFNGQIYSLITYPFYCHSVIELILNALMLWLMGSEFESNWGTRRYLNFLLSCVLGGGALYLLVCSLFFKSSAIFSFHLVGLSGIVSSLCVAYAVIYPDRLFSFMMIIPVKAKYFCFILVAISLSQGFSGPGGVGAWGQLGGILSAYLFMLVISHRNFKSLSQKISKLTQSHSRRKGKARLSIVKDNEDDHKDTPKYWH